MGSPFEGVPFDVLTTYVQELTASSLRAIAKIEADGSHAKLTDSELRGTEAIIAVWGRPAILIQDGAFFNRLILGANSKIIGLPSRTLSLASEGFSCRAILDMIGLGLHSWWRSESL